MKRVLVLSLCVLAVGLGYYFLQRNTLIQRATVNQPGSPASGTPVPSDTQSANPLSIVAMRQKPYPTSVLHIEQTLASGSNFSRYISSYRSEGLIQYGLLTVPTGTKPANGWPVILFHHGYIPPDQYSTENSYSAFVDVFAKAGYIVFKPDYRGNGGSHGAPLQPYISADYVTDSMNALSSIQKYPDANPQKIGVFGHSMGGNIVLHELVISKDIKAAELMAGVVGDESGIVTWWNQRIAAKSIVGNDLEASYVITQMVKDHGTPLGNPDYWNAIDPTKYISDITASIDIQVGTQDTSVPQSFSSGLRDLLVHAGKSVTYQEYNGADHNLSPDTSVALSRAVSFFDRNLK